MATVRLQGKDRAAAAVLAGALVVLLLWVLLVGLAVSRGAPVTEALQLFDLAPPPPPPVRDPPKPVRNYRPAGEAAPPNLRSKPTEIVAPKPLVVLPVTAPVVTAPVAGPGVEASAGAADVPGPGTGAGGEGNGFGGGGDGDGAGDVPPRQIGGRLRYSDYPRDAMEQGISGTVRVRFVVDERGRVPSCEVIRSSGWPSLDDTTCRLIVQRYRFRPAHDARGRPFVSRIVQNEAWELQEDPPERRR